MYNFFDAIFCCSYVPFLDTTLAMPVAPLVWPSVLIEFKVEILNFKQL